jgi:signal transduction histidine kinase
VANPLLLLPDFLLILLGFVICRGTALDRRVWDAAERLVYFLLFPVLLFNSILKSPLQLAQAFDLGLAGVGMLVIGIAVALAIGRWPGVDRRLHASGAQVAYRFNSYIALALAERLYGAQGLAWMALLMAISIPICNVAAVWPLARHGGHSYAREIARNPLIWACVVGLAINLTRLPVPRPAYDFLDALVAIKTFVDALKKEDRETGLGEIVTSEIERINSIVGQTLKLSGAATPTFTELHVHDVMDQSVRLIAYQVSEKRIQLRKDFGAALDLVRGDAYQLEQAFLNLFLNALAATGIGGELRIGTQALEPSALAQYPAVDSSQKWLRVTVRDTGTGIAPDVMEHLFEPFFTTKPEGTGLGLSITRRIVREHGGVISVESRLGKGTTFIILLPVVK